MNNSITKEIVVAENEVFDNYFSNILADIGTIKSLAKEELSAVRSWTEKVSLYNATQGKKTRGNLVPLTVRSLVKSPTEIQMKQAYVVGWSIEFLQASSLIADDIMDKSTIRRGMACWYLVDGLGEDAFNDAFLLEHVAYQLIKKHFRNTSYYNSLMDIFLQTAYETILGQSLDTLTGRNLRYEEYTMERYNTIVKYKSSYYTFYLPIAMGAIISNVENPNFMEKLEQLANNLGLIFQVLDDYFDCFGSTTETGKDGTDIQNGKCSWLFVRAKELCSAEQLSELCENYGQDDKMKVARIVEIYEAINMSKLVYEFTENMIKSTLSLVDQIENEGLKFLYYQLLKKAAKQMNIELPTGLI